MNKIYKVIWSKTRNCYVAVAEFVKRNGKGGSVMNRRHIAAALKKLQQAAVSCDGVRLATPFTCRHVAAALAAAALFAAPAGALANSGGHYDGNDYIGDAPYEVVIDSGVRASVYGRYESFGSASEASVTVNSGGAFDVYGGYSSYGFAERNTVTINDTQYIQYVFGGYSIDKNATENSVVFSGGELNEEGGDFYIYGGYSEQGNAKNNTVNISGGKYTAGILKVYGGYSEQGNAENNTVILSKEENKEAPFFRTAILYGGYSKNGTVSNNTLQVEAVGLSAPEIRNFDTYKFVLPSDVNAHDTMLSLSEQTENLAIDSSKVDVSLAGGSIGNTGLNDRVTLLHKTGGDGAFIVQNLTGAVQTSKLDGVASGFDVMKYTLDKPAGEVKLNVTVSELYLYGDGGTNTPGQRETGNTLTITGGKASVAFGGRAASGNVTGNKVTMTGGEIVEGNSIWIGGTLISGDLSGGFADTGNAEKNAVEVSGGTVNGSVTGGYSLTTGSAKENSVTVSGGTVGTVYGGYSGSGSAEINKVIVSGGKVNNVYGGRTLGDATGNEVTVEDGTVANVYGGLSTSGGNNAEGNRVTISGGVVNQEVYGGQSRYAGNANNNTVTISGGTVNAIVYGGQNRDKDGRGNLVAPAPGYDYGAATGNTVIISGGKVNNSGGLKGGIYGGYNLIGAATGNTVILTKEKNKEAPELNVTLYGGYGKTVSNNTLQVEAVGLSAPEIRNFDNYKFVLPSDVKAGDIMLSLGGGYLTIDGSKVSVSATDGLDLGIDERVTLIDFPGITFSESGNEFIVNNADKLPVLKTRLDNAATGFVTLVGKVERPGIANMLDLTVTEKYLYGDGGTNTPGQRETGNALTISEGDRATAAFGGRAATGDVTGNKVKMTGGELVQLADNSDPDYNISGSLYGGYSREGNAEDNRVTVEGGTVEDDVFGGYSYNGDATGNALTVSGGTIHDVYGGYSYKSDATGNSLTISNGTVEDDAYGGYSREGNAEDNRVTVEGGAVEEDVSGGRSVVGSATGNSLTISNGTVNWSVYGGHSSEGNAENNTVTLSGGTVGEDVYGGRSYDGNAVRNTVTIEGDTVVGPVYAGRSMEGVAEDNILNMYGGTVQDSLSSGYSDSGGTVKGNKLNMTGGKATAAFGGRATTGDVTGNKVTMSGGELVVGSSSDPYAGYLYGGLAEDGNANGNTVTINDGSSIERSVHGGNASKGASGNEVTVNGGTVGETVTGGTGFGGDTTGNSVTIHGGRVGGVVHGGVGQGGNVSGNRVLVDGGLFTGYSIEGGSVGQSGNAVGNAVTVAGSATVQSEMILGGMSNTGIAEKNAVTLGGGAFTSAVEVIGGHGFTGITDNAVNLTGDTKGLDGAKLRGYSDATVSHSGNELHVGGVKTYDANGTATVTRATWQGMDAGGTHTNKVDTVANFDSIALHNVVWGSTPALSAKNMENIGGLDVTGLEFFTHPDNSTVHEHALTDYMVLVHSDNNELTGMKISYLDEGTVKTEALTNEGIDYHTAAHHTEKGGVTVDGKEVKRIYLAEHNKSVDFFYHIDGEKITLGDVAFVKDGTARYLDRRFDVTDAAIDADSLKMTADSIVNAVAGDTMTVLDAEDAIKNAKGETLKAFTGEGITGGVKKYDVAFSNPVAGNGDNGTGSVLTLSGIHTDTLAQNGDKTKLTYTVGENVVREAKFDGALDWKKGGSYYINEKETLPNGDAVYHFNSATAVSAEKLTVNDTTEVVAKGDAMTLVAADGLTGQNTLIPPSDGTFGVSYTDPQGIAYAAQAGGEVKAAENAVHYEVAGVAVDSIDLAKWNGAVSAMPEASWELAKDTAGKVTATVETDGMDEKVLHSLNLDPGQSSTILTGNGTDYFDGVTVAGEYVWHENGSAITRDLTENGVTIAGTETKGGVRVDEADKNRLIYTQSQENVSDLTLEGIAFANGTTARSFDKTYNLTGAAIHAGDADTLFTEASRKTMNAGDAMTVVDAEGAMKNAKGETLKAFTGEGVTGGVKTYDVAFTDDVTTNLTLSGTHRDTLSQNAEKTKLTYTVGEKNVSDAVLTGELVWQDGGTHYTNKDYNFNTDAKTDLQGLAFATVTADPFGQSMTLIGGKAAGTVENAPASFGVSLAKANTTLDATAAGAAAIANEDVTYSVTGVTLDKVTVNQVTAVADTVPDGWTVAKDASGKAALTIDTENMQLPMGSANTKHAILTIADGSFAGATVTGQYAYASHSPFTKANGGVSIAGEKEGGVKLSNDNTSVVYHVVQDHVKDVTLGSVNFAKDTALLTVGDEYEFTKVNTVNTQNFAMNYAAPQNVAAHDSMTLLQANNTLQANALLANMAADVKTKTQAYSFSPAEGVNVAARIIGSLGTTATGDGFTYTVNSNQADKLTFGSVDWKDSGALFARPAAVSFDGADVDTSKIHFKNIHELDANKQMTLVSDFGKTVGSITGSKYYIGTTLEGEGSASLNAEGNLMFTTKTGVNRSSLHAQEQTHNTVMGMTAGIGLLASGAEQISQAMNALNLMDSFGGAAGAGTSGTGQTGGTGGSMTDGSGSPAGQAGSENNSSGQAGSESTTTENGGSDPAGDETTRGEDNGNGSGTGSGKGSGNKSDDGNEAEAGGIIIASVGGGKMHQETGSHVTSNTWNGVLGIGGKRSSARGTLQYAAFAEHGRADFTLHSDTGRGDGDSRYTGGGLIGKWQNRRDVYVEASIRAGRMHDSASDMLYDEATGRSYGYDVHANYIGGHVGIGKVFYYGNGRSLDVYGKYFHMKRDGVSFEAGGHFDLDSVTSSVLRVGARYGATDKKWNWYGGLAYEYEFDGKAMGRADGAPIRAASIEGGSVRAEIGLRMEATKTNPWKADINLSGYAGKRRGISGSINVAYTF